MESKYSYQQWVVENAKRDFLDAKNSILNDDDLTSDAASERLDRIFATRNAFIEASICFAKLAPTCTPDAAAQLDSLQVRAQKSPAIREQLLNMLLNLKYQ